jgi:hypothetical protein
VRKRQHWNGIVNRIAYMVKNIVVTQNPNVSGIFYAI